MERYSLIKSGSASVTRTQLTALTRRGRKSEQKQLRFLVGNLSKKITCEQKLYSLCKLYLCPDVSFNCGLFTPKSAMVDVYKTDQPYTQWKVGWDMWQIIRCGCLSQSRQTIYLQPLEQFPDFVTEFSITWRSSERKSLFELLRDFAQIFFAGKDVFILSPLDLKALPWDTTSRIHPDTNQCQLLVSDFFPTLQKILPKDGFCIMGITWTDLYPEDKLNFILGESSLKHQAGVFCFGRFEPILFQNGYQCKDTTEVDDYLLWKLLKVMTHEICHLFGLRHCQFFECAMNESQSVKEAMLQPIFLCPVCLRKLQKACGFDVQLRYKMLWEFFTILANRFPYSCFVKAQQWLSQCLSFLHDNKKHRSDLTRARTI